MFVVFLELVGNDNNESEKYEWSKERKKEKIKSTNKLSDSIQTTTTKKNYYHHHHHPTMLE